MELHSNWQWYLKTKINPPCSCSFNTYGLNNRDHKLKEENKEKDHKIEWTVTPVEKRKKEEITQSM